MKNWSLYIFGVVITSMGIAILLSVFEIKVVIGFLILTSGCLCMWRAVWED